ncbi:helix-turn-helix domain-containing protein [Actinoplanes sp. NBRC 103695]|uniref:GbsR/MarR family transcriptional regulator n=1 Tax=Actinoplanes sp. NBRC 103695 TaxID=3032202 RepID=UPI0024A52774|nr:helix-turn-helix domain-containing protein [Actinoplanes sp. NBRC 103695]GLZ00450.1 hypothetical protein Acsp02_77020 [Actinoplanes sp. NBRC 103695]
MPGSRLGQDDRRRIAAWLGEGLGYAEIGRRLGRPTSTISREVARNGERDGYQADHVAVRRPRRKPSAAPPMHGFGEHFAALLTGTGLPRMSARVFVSLLLSDTGSRTAGELARQLRVSPASVSKAVAYLEVMDMLVRTPDAGSRRERYVVADDLWQRAWKTDTTAHADVAAAAQRGARILGARTPAGQRLRRMGEFFGWLSEQMHESEVVEPDALTVLAALVHAARPLCAGELATGLDWPRERVDDALGALERRPAIADPLVLAPAPLGAYTIMARPDRLSATQRKTLAGAPPGRGPGADPGQARRTAGC